MNSASLSPRQEGNVIYWYEGNTFTFNITFNITNEETQEPVVIQPTDVVVVTFKRNINDCNSVYEFTFTNVENNKISMRFSSAVTAKFPRGEYVMGSTYIGANTTTLIATNKVVVERSVANGCTE